MLILPRSKLKARVVLISLIFENRGKQWWCVSAILVSLKQPRFSCLQVADEKNGGQLKWVRTEVDLDNHVKVPSPDLNQVESADMHSPSPLFMSCSRKVSDPDALPTLPASKKQKPCSSSGGFLQRFIRLFSVLLIYWNTLVDVVMFLITILFLDDTKTPLKGPSGVGSTPRRIVHRIVSLDDVKLVKNAMNATINDVMVGVTQAALSRYLNRKYGKQFLNYNLLQILLECKIINHIPSKTTADRPVAIYETMS
ncbi:hypothetical protein OIU76_023717 [Salix suchowensis]|nr:hypothetical protein OIU76_023717 [Salix suchowensis]